MQGDLSRKEWVAPALSPLTEGAGGTGNAGTGQGFGAAISNAVEGAKGYLPPQVWSQDISTPQQTAIIFYCLRWLLKDAYALTSKKHLICPCAADICCLWSLLQEGVMYLNWSYAVLLQLSSVCCCFPLLHRLCMCAENQ